ncbi:MAG: hypothetical protein ACNA75_03250 [Thiohalomonadaceae bacterium]
MAGFSGLASASTELPEIAQLARGGASELALQLLDQSQPAPTTQQLSEWMRWERLRLRIMEQSELWPQLAQRLAQLPEGLPPEFVDWALLRRAIALLHSGDYAASRQLLRELLWRETSPPPSTQIAEYRQWLIQGYLQEGRHADALTAMQRHQLDYQERDPAALMLQARVLLAAGRAAEAMGVLNRLGSQPEARILLQLAALRSTAPAKQVMSRLQALADELPLDAAQHGLLSGSMAEAALAAHDQARLILALQNYLSQPHRGSAEEGLFAFDGDALWQAWLAYGMRLGNQEQLLIGDDAAWLAAAEKTELRYPVRKRSLYAVLALRGADPAYREQAHHALVAMLATAQGGNALVQQLYLHAARQLPREQLPQSVAHQLVDRAIRDGDLQLASSLLQQLPEPPSGTARFAWQMRRAKVFILAAEFDAFTRLIEAILPQLSQLSAEQRDQLIQVLFDLQHVGEHQRAYQLLLALHDALPIQSLRRELLFWMADSRAAQGQHLEAARLYLQSATLGDANSMDPWAQTARYQAAGSLSQAGLLRDAQYIYRQLLRVTDNPERRAVLLREMEQLQMRLAARGR